MTDLGKELDGLDDLGGLTAGQLENLLYIVGSARGGTTVLQRAMGLHDELLMLPKMSHFVDNVWPYRKKLHARLLKIIHWLPFYYREEEVVRALGEDGERLKRYINATFKARDPKRLWQLYPLVYSLDEESGADNGRIRCWADKGNGPQGVRGIARLFPKARFVYIIRDPRGVIASQTRRAKHKEGFDSEPVECRLLVNRVRGWLRMASAAQQHRAAEPDRVYILRMEDFLRSPVETLNDIFRFALGSEMAEDELGRRLDKIVYTETNDRSSKSENHGISTRPIDRWKTVLTEDEVSIIDAMTGDYARAMGYEVQSHGNVASVCFRILKHGGFKRTGPEVAKFVVQAAVKRPMPTGHESR